jgi:predicted DNA-binding antitoxin AbrB/MazE fold protein
MTITIDATYEDGVLKPSQPLPLREHETVWVTVEARAERAGVPSPAVTPETTQLTIGERIAALARDLPPEVIDSWPTDGASQHDHYLYGTPKRPE